MLKKIVTNIIALICVIAVVHPVRKVKAEVLQNATYKIETFTTEHFDGSENGVWNTVNTDNANHLFSYRTSLAVSGEKSLEKGAVTIDVPISILKLRDGTQGDAFQMSVPSKEEIEKAIENGEKVDSKWQYEIKNDRAIITNIEEISAGSNNYIEYGYKTIKRPSFYRDMEVSKNVVANVSIKTKSGELNTSSSADGVKINTATKITELDATVANGNVLRKWDDSWGAKPVDADDYHYSLWKVSSRITGNQPYNLTFNIAATSSVGKPVEVVRYNIGSNGWSESNAETNSSVFNDNNNYRYDYFLTRHKKSTYDADRAYKIATKIAAVVHPVDNVDADSSLSAQADYPYQKPEFVHPTGAFYHIERGDGWRRVHDYDERSWESLGIKLGRYSRYDLEKFQNGTLQELDRLDFGLATDGFATPWTIRKGDDWHNPDNFHKENVTYTQEHCGINLVNDNGKDIDKVLTSDDYELKSITVRKTMLNPEYDTTYMKFGGNRATPTDKDIIDVYAKYGNLDSEWQKIAVYHVDTDSYSDLKNGVNSEKNKLIFDKNVVAYKLVSSDKYFYSSIDTGLQLALKHSSTIDEYVKDKTDITIKSSSKGTVTNYLGETVFERSTGDYDYVRRTKLDSSITKNVVSVSNNKISKLYSLNWEIAMKETMQTGSDGKTEIVEQDGGTFYDLLPNGMSYVDDSISLKNSDSDKELPYNIELVPNFRRSGRTLLKVSTRATLKDAKLYFSTSLDYASILDYGKQIYNPVAFETGDKEIANGKNNDGQGLQEYQNIFKNISNSRGKKFIYAQDRYSIQALFASSSGLLKQVKDSSDIKYSYSTVTESSGNYSYRLRFENAKKTLARDLVFFDSLENFVTSEGKASAWRGVLSSIDTTQLESMGIKPQVYVNTIDKYNLETQRDKTPDEMFKNNWTKLEEFTGKLSDVKSVAIDCRKKQDGTDFVLGKGKSLTAVLNMKAPDYVQADGTQQYAYNNVYAYNTIVDERGNSKSFYIHQDYTEIRYIIAGNLHIHVTSSKDDAEIGDIEFNVYGPSKYGDNINKKITSDKNGNINFKKIPQGKYTLVESKATPDFLQKDHKYELIIDEHGKTFVDGVEITTNLEVVHDPRIHADIEFFKKSSINKDGLQFTIPDTQFSLMGTSDYGNEVLEVATSDSNGVVNFKNIEKGTYNLTETKANKNYRLDSTLYKVNVNDFGGVTIYNAQTKEPLTDNTITNHKLIHNVNFKKVDSETLAGLSGAEFDVHGTDADGNPVSVKCASGSGGMTKFNIPAGSYFITETHAPSNLKISYQKWASDKVLIVNKDGTFTIEGETKDENEIYLLKNEKECKGEITIHKKWEGGNPNGYIPKITITDSEEVFRDSVYTR